MNGGRLVRLSGDEQDDANQLRVDSCTRILKNEVAGRYEFWSKYAAALPLLSFCAKQVLGIQLSSLCLLRASILLVGSSTSTTSGFVLKICQPQDRYIGEPYYCPKDAQAHGGRGARLTQLLDGGLLLG